MDCSLPSASVHGILQARILEWVAISFSNAWKWKVKVKSLSRVQLFVTPWTVACQEPLSMGFSRQEYWSGLPCPPPWDVPDPGIEPTSLMSPASSGMFFTTRATWTSVVAQLVKNPPAMWETWVWSLVGKISWRRKWLPSPVFWCGEFHGLLF